jgi:hypothetical protein
MANPNYREMWANDNVRNYPYLLIDAITDANGNPIATAPTAYTKPPELSQTMGVMLQITDTDMKELLGNQQIGEQMQPNMSGKAIELVQNKIDMQAYIYMSNMASAVARTGVVWLSMAKEIYTDPKRKLRGITEQGDSNQIVLMNPTISAEGGFSIENNLTEADFDVDTTVGASSESKRQSIFRALTGMMQITQDPETMQVLSAMAMLNIDGEGVGDVRDYFRNKLVHMGAVKPTEEEAKQLQAEQANQQPDPQAEFLRASAMQAQAQAQKAQADTVLVMAKAEETRANTVETIANLDLNKRKQLLAEVTGLGKALQDQNAATARPQKSGE